MVTQRAQAMMEAVAPVPGPASTVLVVDDHCGVREALRDLFEPHGYHVLEAADGPEAIAVAEAQRPDCVLLDVRMPGMSGFDVLDRLSQDPRTREIPVIMLTGSDETLEEMDRALRGGAVDYLAKPMRPAHVVIRVRGAIERRRLLQEVQELRRNFTSMLVHDLRSPITVINAYAELLREGGPGPVCDRQRQLLSRIQDSCGRMVRLIGEILDLSKLEAGKLELERQRLDLATLAGEVAERFGPSAQQKSIAFDFHRPVERCMVFADAGRMDQVLMNLLGNALKFTPRGGGISVEVALRGDEVEMSVSDSGPGIGPDELPLLFERFSQTSSARTTQSPGTGLGLLICRHLMEAHDGTIWAESEIGRGSRFVVRLPAA